MKDSKTIPINLPADGSYVVVKNELLDPLESIAESLKSIDQSLKKISGEKTEKIPGPVKKSYAERYFTYTGGNVKESDK